MGDGPGGFYTKDDYREIVAYAARRFITVVPEIDLPGHTNAALASYPELTADGVGAAAATPGSRSASARCAPTPRSPTGSSTHVLRRAGRADPGTVPAHRWRRGADARRRTPTSVIVNRAQEIVAAHGKTVDRLARDRGGQAGHRPPWSSSGARRRTRRNWSPRAAQGNRVIMSPADRAYLDMSYDEASPLGLSWAGHISVRPRLRVGSASPTCRGWTRPPSSASRRCTVDGDGRDPGRPGVPGLAPARRHRRGGLVGPG